MGILNENLDENIIIRVKDLVSTFNLCRFNSIIQRELIQDEILNEDVETIIDCNKFIEKYCKPFGLSAEMFTVDVKRNTPGVVGQVIIQIFFRTTSGAKFRQGEILLDVKERSLIDSIRAWNKKNNNIS